MKHFLPLVVLCLSLSFSSHSQLLISADLIGQWSFAQMPGESVLGATYGVKMYKIVYHTISAQGDSTIASGALFLPNTTIQCEWPMVAYMHGTVYEKSAVPSNNSGEALIGKYMGGYGFVGVLPDYLGLGESPGLHPYMHAATEASATIDMMRACREYCDANEIILNGEVFLTGYSQGGHSTMATLREIELNLSDEFNVIAAGAGSGPYDLAGVQAETVAQSIPYESPEYLPYIIFSYQSVYGTLYDSPSDFLISPYDTILPPLFNGMYSGGFIASQMPSDIPNEILIPEQLDDFNNNPDNPMRLALADNNLLDWPPSALVRLYYCTGDGQVFYENSLVAYDAYTELGSTSVELMEMGTGGHGDCVSPSLFSVLGWFQSLKSDCAVGVMETDKVVMNVFPNPASDFAQIQFSRVGTWNIRIMDLNGKTIVSRQCVGHQAELSLRGIPAGMYLISVDEVPGKVLKLMVE